MFSGLKGDITTKLRRIIQGHEHHGEPSNKVDGGYPSIATIRIEAWGFEYNSPFFSSHSLKF